MIMRKTFFSKLTSLFFVVFLLLNGLTNSLAHHPHQANVFSTKNHVFARKVLVDANKHVAKPNKVSNLGGRKMKMDTDTNRKVQEDDHWVTTKNPNPMLSGNDQEKNALKTNPMILHDGSHNQVEEKALEGTQSLEAKTNQEYESKKGKYEDSNRHYLEATKEMMSLMYKDYSGIPRRRPPINNHYPRP